MNAIRRFCRSQPVLVISFLAALITVCIIPPDAAYLGYCNRTVLIELFCLMLTVAGLRSSGFFERATQLMLRYAGHVRRLGLILWLMCFVSAMVVTNDVALLTFVPLTILIFERIPDEKSRILTIVLEAAAANLGSMLTPIGNPQNLYLYDAFHLTAWDFVRTMLPAGLTGVVCLLLLTGLLPKTPCRTETQTAAPIRKKPAALYTTVFLLCLLTVFRVVPDWVCLLITVITALVSDRTLLLKVDYALLATFLCFFVFVGNIARIEAVRGFFSSILQGRELLISALLSQGISNVPAAVMLSGFTENGTALMLGVDIGGFGTLIASLASLIAFQLYRKSEGARTGQFMLVFSAVNFGMLAVLLGLAYCIR